MEAEIIKSPTTRTKLQEMAQSRFGDLIKAVVDVEKEIMAVGMELHSDGEVMLAEQEGSKREYTWGINLYPLKPKEEWIELDSLINIKPAYGNRSRGVENPETREKIKKIVSKLVV